jgi:hypothetical protein
MAQDVIDVINMKEDVNIAKFKFGSGTSTYSSAFRPFEVKETHRNLHLTEVRDLLNVHYRQNLEKLHKLLQDEKELHSFASEDTIDDDYSHIHEPTVLRNMLRSKAH